MIGFDSGQAQLDAITNGTEAGAITQNPVGMGAALVKAAVEAMDGKTLPKTIDTGFYWYDATNIDDAEDPGGPLQVIHGRVGRDRSAVPPRTCVLRPASWAIDGKVKDECDACRPDGHLRERRHVPGHREGGRGLCCAGWASTSTSRRPKRAADNRW